MAHGKIGHLPWDDYPPLRKPDQSRYGPAPATTVAADPRPPRWELVGINDQGAEFYRCIVNGEAELEDELRTLERRGDFGAAIAGPLRVRRSA